MRKLLRFLLIIICISGIIFSSYKIIERQINLNTNNILRQEISSAVEKIELPEGKTKYNIDFEGLKKRNAEVVSYLVVKNTNIDYAVVRGINNSFYLTHNLDKKYNVAGWIFADYHNKFDGTDKNIVIYGHKMKNGTMFGTLKDILNKSWYQNEDNREVILVTETATYYYEVFSIYSIEPEDYYINTIFNTDEEYITFLQTIKNRSIYNYNTEVNVNDKVLTLSSCLDSYNQKRVVLHAKLVDKS